MAPVYIGNFTTAIALASLDEDTGQLTASGTVEGVRDPAFLTLTSDGKLLYAVNDSADGRVTALSVGTGGGLTPIGSRSSEGVMPTHLSVHPRGGFLLVPDLGTDRVHVHSLDLATGRLGAVGDTVLRSGSGPRHLVFHPTAPVVYVAGELDSTVTVCDYDPAAGKLAPGQVLAAAPGGGPRNYPAEIVISQDGRFVYVSNRGHNSIAVFAVESGGRRLRSLNTVPCGGNWPRHITIDESGRLLFASNQYSNSVTTFRVDTTSGALRILRDTRTRSMGACAKSLACPHLSPLGGPFSTPSPVCLLLGTAARA
ncbi:lactonase family protein [Amycolatopsis nigrescens]|uniref:lactonase family protein n=1 Tax=Amycolatopsis nigrescens TaxID=381445 RepID=UPI000364698C|nr:lactonase family protein [Amycolatopsis nigrescens]